MGRQKESLFAENLNLMEDQKMEIKTCEQYVITRLQDLDKENELLRKELEEAHDQLEECKFIFNTICRHKKPANTSFPTALRFATVYDNNEEYKRIKAFLMANGWVTEEDLKKGEEDEWTF